MKACERFSRAENFMVYYGEKNLPEELSRFDISIVEPSAYGIDDIAKLRNGENVVLGYIGIMEIRPEQEEFDTFENCLLKIDDNYMVNERFGTYFVDLRCNEWIGHLRKKIGCLLEEYKFDGLFLDTIGNAEDPLIPVNTRYELFERTTGFLTGIKNDFPNCVLVQNNGLESLINYTRDKIDGVCWENIEFKRGIVNKWNKAVAERLSRFKSESDLKVMLLTEESKQEKKIRKFASRRGFLYYNAPRDYINFSKETRFAK